MSYYVYFKLKPDSKYKDWTKPAPKLSLSKNDNSMYAIFINAYYETNARTVSTLVSGAVHSYIWDKLSNVDDDFLQEMKENKNGEMWRNRPESHYDMIETVENWDKTINRIIKSLVVICSIKFVKDDTYSDTPKSEMEYLQYDFINKIDEEIDYLDECIKDYALAKFVTENCLRRGEDEEEWESNECTEE